jgi:iron complex outermembrane receptor protein
MDRWVKNLTLTLGSRYTLDTKHFTGQTAVYGAGAVAACGGSPYGLDPSCAGPTGTTTQYPQQSAHWYNFSPKVTLSYKVADALLYATFSKGYASGVYNVTSPSNPGPAAPETLTDYELGVKSVWFDGRLRVNASAYLYSFQNLQVEVVNFGAEGSTTTLQNAANARAYGFENNLDFAITRELRISTAVNLEHTEYTSFPSFSGVNLALPCTGPANCNPTAALDVTGNQLTHAPEVVLSGGMVYDHDLGGDRGGVHGSLHWYHNGGFWWTAQNGLDGGVRQTAYNVANANAAYTFPGNQWTITAWVSNLTNQYYRSAVLPLSFLGVVAVDAPPRMFGATVTYKTK